MNFTVGANGWTVALMCTYILLLWLPFVGRIEVDTCCLACGPGSAVIRLSM
jgi:hypothetical protein